MLLPLETQASVTSARAQTVGSSVRAHFLVRICAWQRKPHTTLQHQPSLRECTYVDVVRARPRFEEITARPLFDRLSSCGVYAALRLLERQR